jgi:hypothetical protein
MMLDARGDQHRSERRGLRAIGRGGGGPQQPAKHVWRARIILATAEGCGTAEIMRRAGSRSPVCGAGKNGSCARVSSACCATRTTVSEVAATHWISSTGSPWHARKADRVLAERSCVQVLLISSAVEVA